MLHKIIIASGMAIFCMNAHAKAPPTSHTPMPPPPSYVALPASMVEQGELVDVRHGFAIRVDQPNWTWRIKQQDEWGIVYSGIDDVSHAAYLVQMDVKDDGKDYVETMSVEEATGYSDNVKQGLESAGYFIRNSSIEQSIIPRKNSFRSIVDVTASDGMPVTYETYFTSPDKLYSIQCIASAMDEQACRKLAGSFRLLMPRPGIKHAGKRPIAAVNPQPDPVSPGLMGVFEFVADGIVFLLFFFIAFIVNKLFQKELSKPRAIGRIGVWILVLLQTLFFYKIFMLEDALSLDSDFDQALVVGERVGAALVPAMLFIGVVELISWLSRRMRETSLMENTSDA